MPVTGPRVPTTGSDPQRPPGTTRAPWEFAAPWGARGYVTPLDGPVHWMEFGPSPLRTVAGLVLIDPALPLPRQAPDRQVASQFLLYSIPGLGGLYLKMVQSRLTPQLAVQRIIDLCFADPSRADPAMITAAIALAAERQAAPHRDESLLAAARSLMRVVGLPRRYFATMAAVRVPVLLTDWLDRHFTLNG